jgi:hypothetical protein
LEKLGIGSKLYEDFIITPDDYLPQLEEGNLICKNMNYTVWRI